MSFDLINVIVIEHGEEIMGHFFKPTTKFKIIRNAIAKSLDIEEFECRFLYNEPPDTEYEDEINFPLRKIMDRLRIPYSISRLRIEVRRKGPINVIVIFKDENKKLMEKEFDRTTDYKVIKDKFPKYKDANFYFKNNMNEDIDEIFADLGKTIGTLIDELGFSKSKSHKKKKLEISISYPVLSDSDKVELGVKKMESAVIDKHIQISKSYPVQGQDQESVISDSDKLELGDTKMESTVIDKHIQISKYPRYPLFIGFGLHSILFWISFGLHFFSSKKFKNRQIIHFFSLYTTETILTLFIIVIYFTWLKKWEYNITFGFLIVCMLFYVILTPFIFKSILKNGKVITQKNHNYFHAMNGFIYAVCAFILFMTICF